MFDVSAIREAVAAHFGFASAQAMNDRSRTRKLAYPRMVGMYLMRRHTNLSLAEIGKEFGGRDHSTVVHAVAAVEELWRRDASIEHAIVKIRDRLQLKKESP